MELWVKQWLHKCRDLSSDPYDPEKSGFSNTVCKDSPSIVRWEVWTRDSLEAPGPARLAWEMVNKTPTSKAEGKDLHLGLSSDMRVPVFTHKHTQCPMHTKKLKIYKPTL